MWKICRSSISGLLVLASTPAFAQRDGAPAASYPARPLRIIVPQSPGASTDLTARLVARALSEAWKQPVVVHNIAGAAGNSAAQTVAGSERDGYTLFFGATPPISVVPLVQKVGYDAQKDFIPIALYVKSPFILVVNPALPIHSVPELIKYVKERPGQLSYSSSGVGGAPHLAAAMVKAFFGLALVAGVVCCSTCRTPM